MTWTRGNKKGCEGIPDLCHFWTAPKPKNSKIYTILKIERRKILFNHCPPLAFNKISVADSNHLYKKMPQYYKKEKPKKLPSVSDFKKNRKRAKKSKFMPDKPRSRIKKGNKKAPSLVRNNYGN